MPFHYELEIPEQLSDGTAAPTSLILKRALAVRGDWLEAGGRVALFEADGVEYVLLNEGPGALLKWLSAEGQHLQVGDKVLQMGADGEDIPYDRAYSSLTRHR